MRQFLTAGVLLLACSGVWAQMSDSSDEGLKPVVAAKTGQQGGSTSIGVSKFAPTGARLFLLNVAGSSTKVQKTNLGASLIDGADLSGKGFNFYYSDRFIETRIQKVDGKTQKGENGRALRVRLPSRLSWFARMSGSLSDFEGEVSKVGDDGQTTKSMETSSGHIFAGTFGFQYLFDDLTVGEGDKANKASLGLSVGWTERHIGGDIASADNEPIRKAVFGNSKMKFRSPEIAVFADMGDFQPFVSFTNFRGTSLSGVTSGRFALGFRATADLFQKPKSEGPSSGDDTEAMAEENAGKAVSTKMLDQEGSQKEVVDDKKPLCVKDPITGNCVLADLSLVENLVGSTAVSSLAYLDSESNRALIARNIPVYVKDKDRYYLVRRRTSMKPRSSRRGFQKF